MKSNNVISATASNNNVCCKVGLDSSMVMDSRGEWINVAREKMQKILSGRSLCWYKKRYKDIGPLNTITLGLLLAKVMGILDITLLLALSPTIVPFALGIIILCFCMTIDYIIKKRKPKENETE